MSELPKTEELLKAGAVLPPDTVGAGERAVPLTARAYRHPGLRDRVVVRLIAGELGEAEDLAAGFLGLEPSAEPVVVGLGLRQALGFPEWVLVHHPQDGRQALAVVPELERAAKQARSKPKAALDAYRHLAGLLGGSVPHFLPTFYEQAGRVFLAAENAAYAAQLFTRARTAEAEHGLVVDEDRLDTVFLEFALAGALPVKVVSGYARELAGRVSPQEALHRFTRLCVRRTAGGLPPSAQTAADLRRLARAAGGDPDAVEQAYLTELLGLPGTLRASTGWWKAHRPALVALARQDAGVRGTLLNLMPQGGGPALAELWLEILAESGATAGLGDQDVDELERPADGTSGWLGRFLTLRGRGWNQPRLPALYALVERVSGRMRAELTERTADGRTRAALEIPHDVDLLDLLLSLDVPVADPPERHRLRLEPWAAGADQRDLLFLAAEPRFRASFHLAADNFSDDQAIRVLVRSPGGRPLLADWVAEVARRSFAAGLPALPEALEQLNGLPAEALLLAEDEVAAAAGSDLAQVLARTLRAGLLDELGWPAWEEAAATLVPEKDLDELVTADAWPHLIVAGAAQARVIGVEGTVLVHDFRIPADDIWGASSSLHYVDGDLLVHWSSRQLDGRSRGYWHSAAGRVEPMDGPVDRWRIHENTVTLPLPGGGRTTGAGVLHRGDTVVPARNQLISDGTSFWVWRESDSGHSWVEYDPSSGAYGREGMPGFLSDALRAAPAGSAFHRGWLLPAPSDEATPAGVPVDGLLGLRVVRLPGGSLRGEDLAGRAVTLSGEPDGPGVPAQILTFPGDDRPRALVEDWRKAGIVDPDGVVTSVVRTDRAPGAFAAGTLMSPPPRYWHCLRPRDPEGSAALRRVSRGTAATLLQAAVAGQDDLAPLIRTLLPQIGHDALVTGVAGVVRFAATQQATLDAVASRLTKALAGDRTALVTGPADQLLRTALSGLDASWSWYGGDEDGAFRQVSAIGQALRHDSSAPGSPEVALHFAGPELPSTTLHWAPLLDDCAALAYRAGGVTIEQQDRDALVQLLRELEPLGLASTAESGRWRRFTLHLDESLLNDAAGARRTGGWQGLLPMGGGAFLAFVDTTATDSGHAFTALFHDPAGRFAVPHPYTVRDSAPIGDDRAAGWLGTFVAEWSRHGPAPWRPEAAEEFARLTGVSLALARLVVAGMPYLDRYERSFLPSQTRTLLGLKVAEAAIARDELRTVDGAVRRAIVAALLPRDPARLWRDGPDVAAAAAVWNSKVGRRASVPEWLLTEAVRTVRTEWGTSRSLPALLDPAAVPELSRDLRWVVSRDRAAPVDGSAAGFTASTLTGFVALASWLAHRLPAGDAVRAALPAALATVHERLAGPGLLLDLDRYVSLPEFRKVAGAPAEVNEGWERYGAVIMATHDDQPAPCLRVSLLDPAGGDPYLPALRGAVQEPFPVEIALRAVRDPRFAALLADPGEPAAGDRDQDGTWWPHDPTRSVPDLVTEVAKENDLGEDAAALYLMLLALPDPTDRHVVRWTGWRPARYKAARAELAATELVVEASRGRAGRSLFLPGGWTAQSAPLLPLEQWKLPLFGLAAAPQPPLGVIVPAEPVADLYRAAWRRVQGGEPPRYQQLQIKRGKRR